MTEEKKDCYSGGERGFMEWGQKQRARLLAPLLNLLARWGVTANNITLLSAIFGLASCPAFLYSPFVGLVLLFIHVLLDGLDGPVARHSGSSSAKGSFTDTAVDQIVITVVMLTLMHMGIIGPVTGAVYIFSYSIVVAFAIIRNYMNVPYSWLLRPRFVIYAWMVVEFYFWPHTLAYIVWFFNILLVGKLTSGFVKIRRKL